MFAETSPTLMLVTMAVSIAHMALEFLGTVHSCWCYRSALVLSQRFEATFSSGGAARTLWASLLTGSPSSSWFLKPHFLDSLILSVVSRGIILLYLADEDASRLVLVCCLAP